ncbi:hypothetical protein FOE78_04330 [Microlunatus elymi]|uniref:Activator of Hsp90 ATPase homologue 1/2-like C-terminal domain-containing protein n=1 Tax=Microlunatus elymi TaxID=2596828 RepID=A0A516PVQ6_9ACTN|nr:SRPBCC family protein [Microlunatus elymi]QDP95240.1 hypothetical protein FOE78_04330 [Microlunatus elymi]
MPQVTSTLDIAAPPSKVWRWFTSQEKLRQWIAPTIEIDLRVGGDYRMVGPDGTKISGVVLEYVPEGQLVLSWIEEDAGWAHPGRLVITLTPISSGTRMTLMHDGFAGIGKQGWQSTMAAYERGIDRHQVLQHLAAAVTGRE